MENVPALRQERLRPSGGRQTIMRRRCAKYHSRFTFFQVGAHGELWLTSCQVRMYPYFLIEKYTAFEYCRYVFSAAGA